MESLREHYALTLRALGRQPGGRLGARRSGSPRPGRARVWRLYMAASALAFERNRIGVNQILAVQDPERRPRGCRCAPAPGTDGREVRAAP